MPLIMNGVTIPTNITNALIFNGTNITKVVFNSTTVWTQSLFNAQWSGNSTSGSYWYFTISTSGNLFRYANRGYTGPWITANLDGTFTGNSLISWNDTGFITSGNLLRFRCYNWSAVETINWCTYTVANKWTGSSWGLYSYGYDGSVAQTLETSGGLIRANTGGSAGPWISLT